MSKDTMALVLDEQVNKCRYDAIREWIGREKKSIQWIATATGISRTTLSKCIGLHPTSAIAEGYCVRIAEVTGLDFDSISEPKKIVIEDTVLGDFHLSDFDLDARSLTKAAIRLAKARNLTKVLEMAMSEKEDDIKTRAIAMAVKALEKDGYGVFKADNGTLSSIKKSEKEIFFRYAGFYTRTIDESFESDAIKIAINPSDEILVIHMLVEDKYKFYVIDSDRDDVSQFMDDGQLVLYIKRQQDHITDIRGMELDSFLLESDFRPVGK